MADLHESQGSALSLGFGAPSLVEQGLGPILGAENTAQYQRDDDAISRLHIRGLITTAQHIQARNKLAGKIRAAFAKATA